ncbi:MAG: hemin transporter substrate-binding protein [Hyphomicrobiales bacterium]|nr:hemin transporter substrate-binding protein [Hyphomicrobiales bacterium]
MRRCISVTAGLRGLATGALLLAAQSVAAQPVSADGPQRIVAAGGVVTEILYDLGLQDRIVAVDTTSLEPREALATKPNVGYLRALSAEGVLSLRPDLVIAAEGAGPPATIQLIEQAGVKVAHLNGETSEAGVADKVRTIGRLTGTSDKAEELAQAIERGFEAVFAEVRANGAPARRVLFLLSLQNGKPVVAGRNTSADAMIRLAGAINAADSLDGYKPIGPEGVLAAAPDIVLTMSRAGQSLSPKDVFALPAFSSTPAAARGALLSRDGLYLLGFGPRTPAALRDLVAAFRAAGGEAGARSRVAP